MQWGLEWSFTQWRSNLPGVDATLMLIPLLLIQHIQRFDGKFVFGDTFTYELNEARDERPLSKHELGLGYL